MASSSENINSYLGHLTGGNPAWCPLSSNHGQYR